MGNCQGMMRGRGNTNSTNDQLRSRINRYKRERLRNMKVFVLDNSLRESTVGQAVGHSNEDKMQVFDATSRCGFKHQIVGCFSTNNRVDDKFAAELQKRQWQFPDRIFYSFSEVYEKLDDKGRFMKDHVPIGLEEMQMFGIINPIIEVDCNLDFAASEFLDQLNFLLQWASDNLPAPPNGQMRMAFINLRDFPVSMLECPDKVIDLVEGIARMPPSLRPAGMLQEEPTSYAEITSKDAKRSPELIVFFYVPWPEWRSYS